MNKLLPLLFISMAPGAWADTIVSGGSSYDQMLGPTPFNSQTSFNLTLSGGQFSNISVSHIYQAGAKGGFDADYLTGFSIQPVPQNEIETIGIATDFSFTLNGVTYYQNLSGSNLPADGGTYSVAISLTPISGTNVLDMTQNSTASGVFSLMGTVSATVNGEMYSDTFNGIATFSGSYETTGGPSAPTPQLAESYVFSNAPEPVSCMETFAGLAMLGFLRMRRKPANQAASPSNSKT